MSIRPSLMRPGGPGLVQISAPAPSLMRTPIEGAPCREMSIGPMLIDRSWIDTGDGVHVLIRFDSADPVDRETTAHLQTTHPEEPRFCLRQYALVRPARWWRARGWQGHILTGAQAAMWLQACGYQPDTDPGAGGSWPVWIEEFNAPATMAGASVR